MKKEKHFSCVVRFTMLNSVHMTGIKIYEDVHLALKVEAARSKRTVPNTASVLLRHALDLVHAGKLDLSKLEDANRKHEEVGK